MPQTEYNSDYYTSVYLLEIEDSVEDESGFDVSVYFDNAPPAATPFISTGLSEGAVEVLGGELQSY